MWKTHLISLEKLLMILFVKYKHMDLNSNRVIPRISKLLKEKVYLLLAISSAPITSGKRIGVLILLIRVSIALKEIIHVLALKIVHPNNILLHIDHLLLVFQTINNRYTRSNAKHLFTTNSPLASAMK